jgi:hypothetical protein
VSEVNFERAAYLRQPIPDGLCLSEQKAFLALRFLYAEFDRGVISKEQAALEKRKLLEQMEHEIKIDKLNERISQLWKRIEQSARDYAMNPTKETADTFYARVYNLEDDWRNDRNKKAVEGVAWEQGKIDNAIGGER